MTTTILLIFVAWTVLATALGALLGRFLRRNAEQAQVLAEIQGMQRLTEAIDAEQLAEDLALYIERIEIDPDSGNGTDAVRTVPQWIEALSIEAVAVNLIVTTTNTCVRMLLDRCPRQASQFAAHLGAVDTSGLGVGAGVDWGLVHTVARGLLIHRFVEAQDLTESDLPALRGFSPVFYHALLAILLAHYGALCRAYGREFTTIDTVDRG